MGFVSSSLLSPLADGAIKLSDRVVMAPLTRMRARQPGNVPGEMNALYYGQRASAGGLIVSEATQISQRGQGYPATPGIHSPEQVEGWRLVGYSPSWTLASSLEPQRAMQKKTHFLRSCANSSPSVGSFRKRPKSDSSFMTIPPFSSWKCWSESRSRRSATISTTLTP